MFICTHCDAQSSKWSGKCLTCDKWGTIIEEGGVSLRSPLSSGKKAKAAQSTPLRDVTKQNETDRLSTLDAEVDRVLGGGIVKGSLVLLSGEPGIGKSTMVAQIAAAFSAASVAFRLDGAKAPEKNPSPSLLSHFSGVRPDGAKAPEN